MIQLIFMQKHFSKLIGLSFRDDPQQPHPQAPALSSLLASDRRLLPWHTRFWRWWVLISKQKIK
jgi:hypothetical protein